MTKRQHRHLSITLRYGVIIPLLIIVFLQSAAVLAALAVTREIGSLEGRTARTILGALLAALVLGLVITWLFGRFFTRPIINLVRQVRQQDPQKPLRLEKTGFREINDLIGSLEHMSADIVSSASRLSSAIDLVGLRLASFEEWRDQGVVHVSDSFFSLLGIEAEDRSRLALDQWNRLIAELTAHPDPAYADVYIWQPEGAAKKRWLRLSRSAQPGQPAGILMDVTDEVLRNHRLELERDYDALTHLLNKPAFISQCGQALARIDPYAVGVMLFSDLDNLKEINDRYGHKFGDQYIQMAAGVFGQFRRFQGLAARLSGDEFAVFLIGQGEYAGKEGLRLLVSQVFAENRQQKLAVPDEKQIALQMSVGLAWYPENSRSPLELINLADFAMYQIKKEGKSGLHEFVAEEYLQSQTMMEGRANLDQLLDARQLECVAQPVVDARTAEITGYAMTMRPLHSRIRLPLEVIELARQQNRLDDLENLMLSLCSEWADQHQLGGGSLKIFFSALAGLSSQRSGAGLPEAALRPLRHRLVVDINGSENYDGSALQHIAAFIRVISGQLAISHIQGGEGTGQWDGSIRADFLHLDHSVIRDIDKDPARQQLLASCVSWCSSQGIQVIAEGIETEAEMSAAIRLGADYLQGYYLGRPQSDIAELETALRLQILSARRLD